MLTFDVLLERIRLLAARLDLAPSLRWGLVTSTDPRLVTLDADTLPIHAGTIAPVTTGDRVLVVIVNRRATILGKAGADPNQIIIDGIAYARSGSVTLAATDYTLAVSEGAYYALIPAARFPATPPGWGLEGSVTASHAGFSGNFTLSSTPSFWVQRTSSRSEPIRILWKLTKL